MSVDGDLSIRDPNFKSEPSRCSSWSLPVIHAAAAPFSPLFTEDCWSSFTAEEQAEHIATCMKEHSNKAGAAVRQGDGKSRQMVEEKQDLKSLPGIGVDLAGKIVEIVTTGTCALREQLRHELPPAIHELLMVPSLGPKRVKALYQELDIQTVEQLYRAARDGEISHVPGFGRRVEQRILEAMQKRQSKAVRFGVAVAEQVAKSLITYFQSLKEAKKVEVAGSFRRRRETVGDLDILVSSPHPQPVTQRFAKFEGIAQVLAQGGTRASAVLRQGMQVDLRVVADVSFGAALHYLTGSKAHNIAMRTHDGEKRGCIDQREFRCA